MVRNFIRVTTNGTTHLIKKENIVCVRYKDSSPLSLTIYTTGSEHFILFESATQRIEFLQSIGVFEYTKD